jgi:hypothetical protein
VLFVKDAGNASLNELHRFGAGDPRSYHKNLPCKASFPGLQNKIQRSFRSEIHVQDDHRRTAFLQGS